jgi:hypothetical protein
MGENQRFSSPKLDPNLSGKPSCEGGLGAEQ